MAVREEQSPSPTNLPCQLSDIRVPERLPRERDTYGHVLCTMVKAYSLRKRVRALPAQISYQMISLASISRSKLVPSPR